MATKTRKFLDEEIKVRFLEGVSEHLENCGEEVLRTGSNKIALPVLDSEENERFLEIVFKVPTGERLTGEEYDGYSEAENYRMKVADKAAKAEQKAREAAARQAKKDEAKAEKAKGKGE